MTGTFEDFVKSLPQRDMFNPHWAFRDKVIVDKETDEPLDLLEKFGKELEAIHQYFVHIYKALKTEAQVIIVTKEHYDAYYQGLPTLPYSGEYVLVVPPQYNTPHQTVVPDHYWHKLVREEPVARVHSHYILPAYQSPTDYASLNSNTLEIVIGNILEGPEYCYWLDQFNKKTKDHTFKI